MAHGRRTRTSTASKALTVLAAIGLLAGCGGASHSAAIKNSTLPKANADQYGGASSTTAPPATKAHGTTATGKSGATNNSGSGTTSSTTGTHGQAQAPSRSAPSGRHAPSQPNPTSPQGTHPTAPVSNRAAEPAVNTKCRQPASNVGSQPGVIGTPPPDFTATTVDCKSLTFSDFTKGRETLVNFYASWCEACKAEGKDMESVYQEWHAKTGFTIVGIDTKDESGSPAAFYQDYHFTFASVWDDGENILNAWDAKTHAVYTLPTSFWIKPDGTVCDIVTGSMDHATMESELTKCGG